MLHRGLKMHEQMKMLLWEKSTDYRKILKIWVIEAHF